MEQVLSDPRRRNLAVLAAAALVSLLLAVAAIWQQANETAGPPAPTEFLPGLAHKIASVARIHIASKSGTFDIVFLPEKGWVVPQRDNYPASYDLVQRTRVGLAALRTIEPKTARPDWLHYVSLDVPPKGDGILISVADDKGRVLASLIAGKSEDIGDPTGATGLFVRRPNENQSWLVRSVLDPRAALSDWLEKNVVDIDRSEIQQVDVDPIGGQPYTLSRAKPSDPDFALTPVPGGKPPSDPAIGDGVAAALTNFGFDDVAPAAAFDFNNPATAARVVTKTFDGLRVTVHILKNADGYWAHLSAEAPAPSTADARKEAAQINARASGWTYKLPAYKGQLFMTTLDSLLNPPAAPAPAQP